MPLPHTPQRPPTGTNPTTRAATGAAVRSLVLLGALLSLAASAGAGAGALESSAHLRLAATADAAAPAAEARTTDEKEALEAFLQGLKARYAPDKRLAVWELQASLSKTSETEPAYSVITGRTDNAEVIGALQRAVRFRRIKAAIDVKLLPEDDPAVGDACWALVSVPTASFLKDAAFAASTVTQAVIGTPLRVLQKEGPFWRAQTPDGYIGWVHGLQIKRLTVDELSDWNAAPKSVVTARTTLVTDAVGGVVSPLPAAGMVMRVAEEPEGRMRVQLPDGRTGFVKTSDIKDAELAFKDWERLRTGPSEAFFSAFADNARMLAGTSYLWGGASSEGVDCSGFLSLLWRLTGVIIGRDADQQFASAAPVTNTLEAAELTIEDIRSIPAGALLAFGKPADENRTSPVIQHVALSLGAGTFIHALGSVRIESLDPASPVFSDYERSRFLGARWITPSLTDVPCTSTWADNGFYQSPPRELSPCRLPDIVRP